MAANIRHLINGEKNRLAILKYMKGKTATSKELWVALNMTKSQLANYIHDLQKSGHIVKCDAGAIEFKYKRTNKPFYTMEVKDKAIDEFYGDTEKEEKAVIKSPHARVIRLLRNPLPPPPKSRQARDRKTSGIQSSMGLFDGY
jgi:acid phosphatase class B